MIYQVVFLEYLAAYIPNNSPNIYINGGNGLTDIGEIDLIPKYKMFINLLCNYDTGNSDIETVDYNINNYYAILSKEVMLYETSNFLGD